MEHQKQLTNFSNIHDALHSKQQQHQQQQQTQIYYTPPAKYLPHPIPKQKQPENQIPNSSPDSSTVNNSNMDEKMMSEAKQFMEQVSGSSIFNCIYIIPVHIESHSNADTTVSQRHGPLIDVETTLKQRCMRTEIFGRKGKRYQPSEDRAVCALVVQPHPFEMFCLYLRVSPAFCLKLLIFHRHDAILNCTNHDKLT